MLMTTRIAANAVEGFARFMGTDLSLRAWTELEFIVMGYPGHWYGADVVIPVTSFGVR